MENASKALIIAGSVLITIIILTIGVRLVGNFSKSAESYVADLEGIELHKYNSEFEVFIDRTDITAQEIVTVVGKTQQKQQGTKVYLINGVTESDISDYTEEEKNELLEDNILMYNKDNTAPNGYTVSNSYSYVSIGYDTKGRVTEIKFKKN